MELIMTTDLAKVLPKSIDFNHSQLKTELSEKLTYYKNLVVTEGSIPAAKKDRAALNKLKTALDDKRKEVKRDCLNPFEDFEFRVKELIAMIDDPINTIDSQLKNFEEQKKSDKEKQIHDFFIENVGDLLALLPLKKIYNPKWPNAGYKMADIGKEITEAIFKTKNNINIIKAFNSDCEQQMLDKYLDTLDMGAAMAEKTRFEEQQKRLKDYEESQRKAAAEKSVEAQKATEPQVIEATYSEPAQAEQPQQSYIPEPEQCAPVQQEQLKTISVTFQNTTADFRHEMGVLCLNHRVKYGWTKREDLE